MKNIKQVVPVLPVALMCEVLIKNKTDWRSELELKAQCAERISELEKAGAPIAISASAIESVLGAALAALIGRGLVDEKDNLYRILESESDIINYYANSIVHWQAIEPH